jgi:internalin A
MCDSKIVQETIFKKRRWYHLRLRTVLAFLLVGITFCGSCIAIGINNARRQKEAVEAIKKIGGEVIYDYEIFKDGETSYVIDDQDCPALLKSDFIANVVQVRSQKMDDICIAHLKDLYRLECLDINSSLGVTDAGLHNLTKLKYLKKLNISRTHITNDGIEIINELSNLEWLDISYTQINGAGIAKLKGLKHLKILNLTGIDLTYAERKKIGEVPINLPELKDTIAPKQLIAPIFKVGSPTNAGLEQLGKLHQLQMLHLSRTGLKNDDLAYLKTLKNLTWLTLTDNSLITDRGLENIKGLINLKWLDIGQTRITDAGLVWLKEMSQLKELNVFYNKVSNYGLIYLKPLHQLKNLNLAYTKVTDAGLINLQDLLALNSLTLSGLEITDSGLEHLKSLKNLKSLDLDDTQITDSGLAHLKAFKKLESLGLDGTQVTDDGLVNLKDLEQLESLGLYGTRITDSGLLYLKDLKKLQSVSVGDTKVTDEGIQKLQEVLPNCEITKSSDRILKF